MIGTWSLSLPTLTQGRSLLKTRFHNMPMMAKLKYMKNMIEGFTIFQCKQKGKNEKMNIEDYQEKIEFWAEARGLNKPEFAKKQCNKVMEEVGEFAGNLARGKCVKDDVGDIFVTIVILAKQQNVYVDFSKNELGNNFYFGEPIRIYSLVGLLVSCEDEKQFKSISKKLMNEILTFCIKNDIQFLECVQIAWDEIKSRKGRMVNGSFVKESDLVS